MTMQATAVETNRGNHDDAEYDGFLGRVNTRFLGNTEGGALFTTDAPNLWELYLDGFSDPAERQYHNCHACRRFIERYGCLATIGEDGTIAPAIWNEGDAPDAYKLAIAALARAVRRARVTGVFLSSLPTWGEPWTGQWRHLAVKPTPTMVYRKSLLTAGQAMAEKREEFGAVMRALAEFTLPHIETALSLFKTDSLCRSEKVLGQAEWLHKLHVACNAVRGDRRTNVVWRAVASAPAGFCHPRSSMIGTLLEDIASGKDFDEVSRAFKAKMHPLQYQRPQAAPTSGAIAAAEKIVAELGAAGSLNRRFARLDEVKALWRPTPKPTELKPNGVFGHLKPKEQESSVISIPTQTMTWDKFQRTVLPDAERIEFLAPNRGDYCVLVTAMNPDAPPILQWDSPDNRNPVSCYVWCGGSPASQYGLLGGQYVTLEAVTLNPSMWNGGFEHQGNGVIFLLKGAKETRQAGAALFPEILKSEFRAIRSVLEAYSREAQIDDTGEPHAVGIIFGKNESVWDARLRVWSGGKPLEYRLDRWD